MIPASDPSSPRAGLYVHIPFCLTRCGYCDFNTYAGLDELRSGYLRALATEAQMHAKEWDGVEFDSVFLGGGTPTMLAPEALVGLLERLRTGFDIPPEAEVTVEANPDTVDAPSLAKLRRGGFTRLSMGAQSFDRSVLASLERIHTPESVEAAFAAARAAGFDDVNIDLIYGAQGETLESWRTTLRGAAELAPEHVSAYALTVEPNTMLGKQVASGQRPLPDADTQAEMYEAACEVLGAAGFGHYEVSNWARPGRECRHNLGYWERRPYLGLGAGAHSFREGRRWWNLRLPERYISQVAASRAPIGGDEVLDAEQERFEQAFLGMRASAVGVSASAFGPAADVTASGSDVAAFTAEGLLRREGDRLVATERGMFVANDLALTLAG